MKQSYGNTLKESPAGTKVFAAYASCLLRTDFNV